MEEIVSLVVANGLFAVLFCGLLVYELRDSRSREARYAKTIRALTDSLDLLKDVKSDAEQIKSEVDVIAADVKIIRERGRNKRSESKGLLGGAECASA
ncbi:MAG: hypothetical protein J1G01_00150 [Clostridiales bacterium]|nr:hypothetical protein [Clostridiales bacterium]